MKITDCLPALWPFAPESSGQPELAAYFFPAVIKCPKRDLSESFASDTLTIVFLGMARKYTQAWTEISGEMRHLLESKDEIIHSFSVPYNCRYYNDYNNYEGFA